MVNTKRLEAQKITFTKGMSWQNTLDSVLNSALKFKIGFGLEYKRGRLGMAFQSNKTPPTTVLHIICRKLYCCFI